MKKVFINWCNEPMSAKGNDREEMFEKIWQLSTKEERETTLAMFDLALANANQIVEHNQDECRCCRQILDIKKAAMEDYQQLKNHLTPTNIN